MRQRRLHPHSYLRRWAQHAFQTIVPPWRGKLAKLTARCKQHPVEGNVLYGHLQTLDYESCWASLQEIYMKPISRIQINHRLPSTYGADSSTNTVSSVLPGWTPQTRNHPITDRPYRHGTCCNNHLLRLKPTTEKPKPGTTNNSSFFTPPIPPMVSAPSSTSIRTAAQAL